MNWLEVSLTVNGELAEAVADVLARFAYSGVMMEQGVKYTNDEDAGTPTGPITVRAYLEVDDQLEDTRRKLEESLYYLAGFSLCLQPLTSKLKTKIGWKHGSSTIIRSSLVKDWSLSPPGWNLLSRVA
jgi:ribosomal protein L11 methylase PrmA